MSIRKRALSLLLVLVMLLGVLPAGAAAAEVYQDVPSGHWASDYIARVAEQGLMVGTSDTTFAPEETITRAMFVTILARYAKAETDNNAETAFTDVPAGQYYTGAVAWAAANGIVNGTSAVTFAPNDPVTREQMAALLYRAMRFLGNKCPQDGKLDVFSDASALSDWAVEGMIWAAGAGLFGGFEDGTLRPQETATRAQAAKVFCVLLDYSEQPEPTEPSAEPTEPSEEPTDPTEPTEPETGFTVTFKGEGGYAKVNGEKVTSVTLEPGVTWLNFNLYGDHSEGFDLDQVAASSGTLQRVRSEFILRDITEDVTVTFTTTGMIVTVTFVSKQVATVTPEKVQVPWGQTVEPATAERSGYTFVSWTTEDGTPFDFSQPVREDVTLYATWKVRMRDGFHGRHQMDTVLFQLVLVVHGIESVPGKAVQLPDQNYVEDFLSAVLDHPLKVRAVIRLGRDGTVNVVLDNGDVILFGIGRAFTDLAFNGFFALVVTGIAGVDHGSHGGHLSFYIIERWSVLSKHCFV